MKYSILFLAIFFVGQITKAQTYAPAAGQPGSTAIKADSSCFVAWATHVEVTRGYVNISDTTVIYQGSNKTTFGFPSNAVGPAGTTSTDAVSLGDSGFAIVTFDHPIYNGNGYDFAIFENGVTDNFLELGLVEVSSDGIHFIRFPAVSLTQTNTQIGGFGSVDPTNLYNLAGKYRLGYGTPFDLEDVKDSAFLDVNHITYIKIIDVIGSIGTHHTVDSQGNIINELFPTPFHSGGFDLTGVGVIHQNIALAVNEELNLWQVYPNPSTGIVTIKAKNLQEGQVIIYNSAGQIVKQIKSHHWELPHQIQLQKGVYFLKFGYNNNWSIKKLIVI